jgi:hypothetical protein
MAEYEIDDRTGQDPLPAPLHCHALALVVETGDNGAAKPQARGCAKRRPSTVQSIGDGEVSIEELLTDPIAELLRRRDRLTLQEVRDCIEDARRKLRKVPASGGG